MELWMTVATCQEILGDAGERQYAVGSFNVWDISSAKHLAAAAERSAAPSTSVSLLQRICQPGSPVVLCPLDIPAAVPVVDQSVLTWVGAGLGSCL
jgi:hypothetical protein